ncbi:glucokinase [Cognatilysobacter lacus]|uniref:Glucokinase n=1 Tax=Cognatilysobacter lacus TaxID=1643323 RepID=A0A5D8Z6W6_9GAMM|nr:glucokinase [Lysobacter lacus]TZF88424.1 glucokinase [Lysobacter lacus]
MNLGLIADIGGTNARFALTDLDASKPDLRDVKPLRCADFASLQHACEHYLESVGATPSRAAMAVASPVDTDEIRLTNRAWSFSRRELEQALRLVHLRMLNDFGAVAWAVPALSGDDAVPLYGPAALPPRSPVTVIGPGTGLGVALLTGDATHGWHVIETEGGHATFAPVIEEDRLIARWLDSLHGRTSNERVLCGTGLAQIDAVMRDPDRPAGQAPVLRDPADVVRLALEGHDVAARRALARFCAILGAVCGDAALMHGARSVMIAGGIVPRFVPFLRASAFRERFLAKGRFAAYLENVAIHVITHAQPGLLGAAVALRATTETPR